MPHVCIPPERDDHVIRLLYAQGHLRGQGLDLPCQHTLIAGLALVALAEAQGHPLSSATHRPLLQETPNAL